MLVFPRTEIIRDGSTQMFSRYFYKLEHYIVISTDTWISHFSIFRKICKNWSLNWNWKSLIKFHPINLNRAIFDFSFYSTKTVFHISFVSFRSKLFKSNHFCFLQWMNGEHRDTCGTRATASSQSLRNLRENRIVFVFSLILTQFGPPLIWHFSHVRTIFHYLFFSLHAACALNANGENRYGSAMYTHTFGGWIWEIYVRKTMDIVIRPIWNWMRIAFDGRRISAWKV